MILNIHKFKEEVKSLYVDYMYSYATLLESLEKADRRRFIEFMDADEHLHSEYVSAQKMMRLDDLIQEDVEKNIEIFIYEKRILPTINFLRTVVAVNSTDSFVKLYGQVLKLYFLEIEIPI